MAPGFSPPLSALNSSLRRDESIMKLSDSFNDPSELGIARPDFISLELVIRVYNINKGHNEPIIRGCKTLEGYSSFIAKVREYEGKAATKDEAMELLKRA
jgi:hypothetical protein